MIPNRINRTRLRYDPGLGTKSKGLKITMYLDLVEKKDNTYRMVGNFSKKMEMIRKVKWKG